MYIRVINDIFDISHRIKDIDDGYFVLYNTAARIFEVHNSKQKDTFCISCQYLDARVLNKLHKTKTVNLNKILGEIEENNQKIAKKSYRNSMDAAKEKFDEIMQYLDSGKNYDPKYT
ncbi:MAG: hypothetical protein LBN07_02460 [Christensenellaceae bacterium]|jgi:hypothetical protein|nr:hypothetical protein [Christensenellaceae bacterium]